MVIDHQQGLNMGFMVYAHPSHARGPYNGIQWVYKSLWRFLWQPPNGYIIYLLAMVKLRGTNGVWSSHHHEWDSKHHAHPPIKHGTKIQWVIFIFLTCFAILRDSFYRHTYISHKWGSSRPPTPAVVLHHQDDPWGKWGSEAPHQRWDGMGQNDSPWKLDDWKSLYFCFCPQG